MESADPQYETAAASVLSTQRGEQLSSFPRRSRIRILILVLLAVSTAPYA